jgi:hypothetical protein
MGMTTERRGGGRRRVGLLHHLAALFSLAGEHPGSGASVSRGRAGDGGVRQRRRRQQLQMAQQLLDPLPPALRNPRPWPDRFWRILRWGGAGFLLAWILRGGGG